MSTEIKVPTLGESVTEATVSSWLKSVGDYIEADEILAELETDKVTLEVPSPVSGTITSLAVDEGGVVNADAVLAVIEPGAAPTAAAPAATTAAAPAKSAAPATPNASTTEIKVPALGESVTEATISSWFKSVGDHVNVDEILAELETDKVTLEVPSPVNGVVASLAAPEGGVVTANALLAVIEAQDGPAAMSASAPAASATTPAPAKSAAPTTPPASTESGILAPAVRRLVTENNLDPAMIPATGKDGRLTKADVLAAIATKSSTAHQPSTSQPLTPPVARAEHPLEERVPMSRLRQVIATRLKEAQNTAAMLTTFNEVDMSAVIALRGEYREDFEKTYSVRLGFMSFFVHAVIRALKDYPAVNAEINGTDIIYKNYYHVGVAVGAPQGLVVPVLKDADKMSFAETESSINVFASKAKDGKLAIADMSGGTFTISNGGIYGSMLSMPIINTPQSAILGMHNIQKRPMVVQKDGEDQIVIKPMMYLALSYDHRIVDGREAVSFLLRIKQSLEDPRRMLIGL